jgi:siderophore synthetase component
MHSNEIHNLIDSPAYRQASRRVLRQLLEALLFENALPHAEWQDGRNGQNGQDTALTVAGRASNGGAVSYQCQAQITFSFGRIRVTTPLLRRHGDGSNPIIEEASDPALFLAEVAPWLNADAARLEQFAA